MCNVEYVTCLSKLKTCDVQKLALCYVRLIFIHKFALAY